MVSPYGVSSYPITVQIYSLKRHRKTLAKIRRMANLQQGSENNGVRLKHDRRTVTGVDFDLDPSVRMRRKWHNPCNGRHYQAELYQDLLGDWILIRTWRGDRHRGNEKMAVVASYQDGLDQISRIASIRTRRGYQLVGAHGNEHNGPPSTLP